MRQHSVRDTCKWKQLFHFRMVSGEQLSAAPVQSSRQTFGGGIKKSLDCRFSHKNHIESWLSVKKKQSQAEQFGPICYQQKIVLFIECALKPDLFIFREQWLLLKLCFSD